MIVSRYLEPFSSIFNSIIYVSTFLTNKEIEHVDVFLTSSSLSS